MYRIFCYCKWSYDPYSKDTSELLISPNMRFCLHNLLGNEKEHLFLLPKKEGSRSGKRRLIHLLSVVTSQRSCYRRARDRHVS